MLVLGVSIMNFKRVSIMENGKMGNEVDPHPIRYAHVSARESIARDQPNSRFHVRDIFREIGLLP